MRSGSSKESARTLSVLKEKLQRKENDMKKRFLALLVAMVMVLGMSMTAMAAEEGETPAAATIYKGAYTEEGSNTEWGEGEGGSASITITLPTEKTAPTADTTYKIYRVFDATSDGESNAISYSLVNGKTNVPSGFVVDNAGNVHYGTEFTDKDGNKYYGKEVDAAIEGKTVEITLADNTKKTIQTSGFDGLTDGEISAIASYVTNDDLICTAVVPAGNKTVTINNLKYGYYYITTSTGTVVTIDSTNPTANVNDKNIIPTVKKSAGTEYDEDSLAAIAEVGTSKDFTAQINIGKGTKSLVFTDTMTNMTYNGDVKVTIGENEVTASDTVNTDAADETFKVNGAKGATSFTLTFDDDYIASLEDSTVITINYSGTVTSDALSTDPANNKATITSGDGNTNESEEVKVYNAKFTVTKKDGNGDALEGAGFVIKNDAGAYYSLVAAANQDDPETKDIDESVKHIVWYSLDDNETLEQAITAGKITEYTSDEDGAVPAFTGLAAGTYTLVESTVPAGYNKAADSTFTVNAVTEEGATTAANLEQTAEITNESGAELPSTGGMGTTIFYALGAVLVLGAGVLMVTKRRMAN